jgi:hypothetical protein
MSNQELLQVELRVDDFMGLFEKEDHYSHRILSVVNEEIRVARRAHDEKARKLV